MPVSTIIAIVALCLMVLAWVIFWKFVYDVAMLIVDIIGRLVGAFIGLCKGIVGWLR